MGTLASQMRGLALEANEDKSKANVTRSRGRNPVVLILDDLIQSLPWESLPGLHEQRYESLCMRLRPAGKPKHSPV